MSSPRLKFNLLFIFRLTFVVNLITAISFGSWAFFVRSRVKDLETSCAELARMNVDLASRLSYSVHYITNDIFSVSSSFLSNVVKSVSLTSSLNFSISSSNNIPLPSSSPVSANVELPPITFSNYFELNGVPFICVRNKYFRQGDMLLGYPVQLISPDVVQYRDKFFKVSDNLSPERRRIP